ncbi:hypothetical protein ACEN4E_08515 [Latilactobacillus sakei]|uniref:hypothetical protein n=1 Tax=Latilactobacillus sakei TaxID=1599 RepID=UPI003885726B
MKKISYYKTLTTIFSSFKITWWLKRYLISLFFLPFFILEIRLVFSAQHGSVEYLPLTIALLIILIAILFYPVTLTILITNFSEVLPKTPLADIKQIFRNASNTSDGVHQHYEKYYTIYGYNVYEQKKLKTTINPIEVLEHDVPIMKYILLVIFRAFCYFLIFIFTFILFPILISYQKRIFEKDDTLKEN